MALDLNILSGLCYKIDNLLDIGHRAVSMSDINLLCQYKNFLEDKYINLINLKEKENIGCTE